MVHPNAFSPPPDTCDCTEDELCNLHAAAPKLLAALGELVAWLGKRPAGIHPEAMIEYTRALDAIEEAKK